jgi:hypothetical protein
VPGYAELLRRPPKAPKEFVYLMEWYDLLRRRNPRGMTYEPIEWRNIESFKNLFGLDLDAFDSDMLGKIDDIWLSVANENAKKPAANTP